MQMTDIAKRVAGIRACRIRAVACDLEDLLYIDFIQYIADTDNSELGDKARLVISTRKFGIHDWTA